MLAPRAGREIESACGRVAAPDAPPGAEVGTWTDVVLSALVLLPLAALPVGSTGTSSI